MSTSADSLHRGHRHPRSATKPSSAASSQNPPSQNSNIQALAQHNESQTNPSPSNQSTQPATPPRTPRRDNQVPTHPSSNVPENGSKRKSRNKNRPKNVMISPGSARVEQNNTPVTGSQTSGLNFAKPTHTPSTAAYAGTTFHASPAPSALPIPSFYSRSIPESPGVKDPGSKLKETPTATPTQNDTAPPELQLPHEESPLDLFFKADREEKARARSASSAQNASVRGPFPPPSDAITDNQTSPFTGNQNRIRPGHKSRVSSSGMFIMELDGESDTGTPYGPAFSTPYTQRISAARCATSPTHSLPQPFELQQQATERSEALKAYLFSGHAAAGPVTTGGGAQESPPVSSRSNQYPTPSSVGVSRNEPFNSRSSHFSQIYGSDPATPNPGSRPPGRSSGLRQEVTPTKTPHITPEHYKVSSASPSILRTYGQASPPARASIGPQYPAKHQIASPSGPSMYSSPSTPQKPDIQGMEDSLRKILKLDPTGSSGTMSMGHVPAKTVSDYDWGRHPPLNGMRDGVMGS